MEHRHCNPIKNQLILGIFVVGLIMLGIIVFVGNKKNTLSPLDALIYAEDFTASGKTLEEIRQSGVSQYCTFQEKQGKSITQGQFVTFQGNAYISIISNPGDLVTFFIFDKQNIYAWNSQIDGGVFYTPKNTTFAFEGVSVDTQLIRNSICIAKEIDARQFLLPPSIIFSPI